MSFIPVNEPLLSDKDREYVLDCINTNWISSEGPYVTRFEQQFASSVARVHGISCSNGTAALEIALKALDIKEGDEVIIPSFTIISCASCIVKLGATPVFVDCDYLTWNVNSSDIEAVITPRTKAIMMVHIYGLTSDIDKILELASKYSLYIIEDAAELIGGTYKGKPCGSFGDISTFSFYPNKHITTGEGGMITTNSDELAEKCLSYRNLCFKPGNRFIHDELGWNYRMTNIQAALGCSQLENLSEHLEKKIHIGEYYHQSLKELSNIFQLPLQSLSYSKNLYWVFGLVSKTQATSETIRNHLADLSIGTRPFFYPMHKQPVFKKLDHINTNLSLPVSEHLYDFGFYIPSGLALTQEQQDKVIESIFKVASFLK